MSTAFAATGEGGRKSDGLPGRRTQRNIRNSYVSFNWGYMGIIKISEHMHERLRSTSTALSRSINAQAEHWLRVGMLAELNPALSYGDICKMLIEAEARGGDVGPAEPVAQHIEQVA
ncbi:hypothetical protein BAR24066_01562 [Burkholderia arboris]|uniref:ParD-like antitoxin of type II toxin-antitoxin system n=2 Tax=Burkholderia arboris TaxID=488730 RepID=A0A9Q9SFL5_9BURK|nr:hypothetical protein BAR24066_01562 [Burkholderia arboris]